MSVVIDEVETSVESADALQPNAQQPAQPSNTPKKPCDCLKKIEQRKKRLMAD